MPFVFGFDTGLGARRFRPAQISGFLRWLAGINRREYAFPAEPDRVDFELLFDFFDHHSFKQRRG